MNSGWLIVALAAVALGIGGYVAGLTRRRRALERRFERARTGRAND